MTKQTPIQRQNVHSWMDGQESYQMEPMLHTCAAYAGVINNTGIITSKCTGSLQATMTVNNVLWRQRVIESLDINRHQVDYMNIINLNCWHTEISRMLTTFTGYPATLERENACSIYCFVTEFLVKYYILVNKPT